MYLAYEQITGLHLELTSRCNLLCPQCARVEGDRVKEDLPLAEVTLEDIKEAYSDLVSQLNTVHICGNYGDPLASETTLPAVAYFRSQSKAQIRLYTNGSARPESWWVDLAAELTRDRDHIVFSIDGLEDTNHIYRRNARWERIMKSASAFIGAGGQAVWEFLAFSHNEHQIDRAKELAKQMGFRLFRVKRPSRFHGVYRNSNLADQLAPAKQFENQSGRLISQLIEDKYKGNFVQFLDEAEIQCRYRQRGWVYVSFQHEMWPCCWLASAKFKSHPKPFEQGVQRLFQSYGDDFLSLRRYSIKELLQSRWYKELLELSWSKRIFDEHNPRLRHCASQCHNYMDMTAMANQQTFDFHTQEE